MKENFIIRSAILYIDSEEKDNPPESPVKKTKTRKRDWVIKIGFLLIFLGIVIFIIVDYDGIKGGITDVVSWISNNTV